MGAYNAVLLFIFCRAFKDPTNNAYSVLEVFKVPLITETRFLPEIQFSWFMNVLSWF